MANPKLLLEWLRASGLVDKLTGGEGTAKKTLPPREGVGSAGPGPEPRFDLDDFDIREDPGMSRIEQIDMTPESIVPDDPLDPKVLRQLLLDSRNSEVPRKRREIAKKILNKHGEIDLREQQADVFTDLPPPEDFLATSRKFENKATTTRRLERQKDTLVGGAPPLIPEKRVPPGKTLDVLDLEGQQSREAHERIGRQLISEGLGDKSRITEQNINEYVQDAFETFHQTFPEFRKKATRIDPGLGTASKRLKDAYRKLSAAGEAARNPKATDEVRKKAIEDVIAIREWLTKGPDVEGGRAVGGGYGEKVDFPSAVGDRDVGAADPMFGVERPAGSVQVGEAGIAGLRSRQEPSNLEQALIGRSSGFDPTQLTPTRFEPTTGTRIPTDPQLLKVLQLQRRNK
jgi:hypothetical protein